MPRITPLRVVSLLPLAWLSLITTWLVLPSPGFSQVARSTYVDSALRRGQTVTAAIPSRKHGKGLLIDWRLEADAETDSVLLHIGRRNPVNLTDAALRGAQHFSNADGPSQNDAADGQNVSVPFVSELTRADVRHGEEDDFYIMPWFAWTDKLLINYQFRHGTDTLELRMVVPEPRVVQIWRDVTVLHNLTSLADIKEFDRETGLLATFCNVPVAGFAGAHIRAAISNIRTTNLVGQLPSRTWPIRYIIAQPLYVPVFFPLNILRLFVIGPVSLSVFFAACLLAIFFKWQQAKRPPFREWIAQFASSVLCCRAQARKARRRGIWGPSGPVADEESGLLGKHPITTFTTPLNAVFKPTKSRPRIFEKA
ncbi:uncharacterized protein B0I36DRAFT_157725 [Microdochium trichocladiopsis]|uniref:Uncharacterized protein n=1 Tax=Microdochium trichocladiopsis TaxID=1682393 RepID=A0A9P8Y0P9_9PEZI|nr:uncharacterized protein B0I36DRAFT_157725 [Microdochium trichocladiopsis]KAH7026375.1 hypothetical protein B0I36DRAFT_157725 [Microdochium trichocladiopsis]